MIGRRAAGAIAYARAMRKAWTVWLLMMAACVAQRRAPPPAPKPPAPLVVQTRLGWWCTAPADSTASREAICAASREACVQHQNRLSLGTAAGATPCELLDVAQCVDVQLTQADDRLRPGRITMMCMPTAEACQAYRRWFLDETSDETSDETTPVKECRAVARSSWWCLMDDDPVPRCVRERGTCEIMREDRARVSRCEPHQGVACIGLELRDRPGHQELCFPNREMCAGEHAFFARAASTLWVSDCVARP
jgi:hypothetical protein